MARVPLNMRRFLRELLGHAGWEAAEAGGTEEALLRDDERFDLLIVELLMPPGPDGVVLIRETLARHPGLPTMLLSGAEAPPRALSGLTGSVEPPWSRKDGCASHLAAANRPMWV